MAGNPPQSFPPLQVENRKEWPMKDSPFQFEPTSGKARYTKLFACISEEEDGYMVQIRLSNEAKPESGAWGEEIVDSFETASELVAALAMVDHVVLSERPPSNDSTDAAITEKFVLHVLSRHRKEVGG